MAPGAASAASFQPLSARAAEEKAPICTKGGRASHPRVWLAPDATSYRLGSALLVVRRRRVGGATGDRWRRPSRPCAGLGAERRLGRDGARGRRAASRPGAGLGERLLGRRREGRRVCRRVGRCPCRWSGPCAGSGAWAGAERRARTSPTGSAQRLAAVRPGCGRRRDRDRIRRRLTTQQHEAADDQGHRRRTAAPTGRADSRSKASGRSGAYGPRSVVGHGMLPSELRRTLPHGTERIINGRVYWTGGPVRAAPGISSVHIIELNRACGVPRWRTGPSCRRCSRR